jgi:Holliday junction resolvase RusA-like endonuclease
MRVQFEVDGHPVPQGSMVASYNRKTGTSHVHHVQGTALAVWRATIREAAREAGASVSPFAISLGISFGMERPKAHLTLRGGRYIVKMQHYYDLPSVQPDIDKLVRAVADALTGVCYRDDAQIVEVHAKKVYAETTWITVEEVKPFQAQDALGLEHDPPAGVEA